MRQIIFTLLLLVCTTTIIAQNQLYSVKGQVISKSTREPIPYAAVVLEEDSSKGSSTDEEGRFEIVDVKPGIYRIGAYSLGYEPTISAEYIISAKSSPVEIVMSESPNKIDTLVVTRSLFQNIAQSPVSLRRIGLQQIEKSAGANRDLSKVVQSYPGVAFVPASNRNDLIIRGGSPSENKFYVDGFELPNINHFSTQGASGGPVGIINADLVREIDLYSGAFPVSKSGALSSILDIRLRDGNSEEQNFKATVGASEVALSGSGHLSDKTNYIFSVRRSYLQLLFKALGLPFLPDFYDAQFKSRTKLTTQDELTFLFIGGLDDMSINGDATSETAEYILSYIPRIKQHTYTAGASYRHFSGSNAFGLYLSHSYVYNENIKYQDNDESSPDNLLIDLRSTEHWTNLRNENRSYLGDWTLRYGAKVGYNDYSTTSFARYWSSGEAYSNDYDATLGFWDWGIFAGAEYTSTQIPLSGSIGIRADGSNYSSTTSQMLDQLSPRASISYRLSDKLSLNAGSGIYHQLPPYTALSYSEQGAFVNRELSYIGIWESTLGAEYQPRREMNFTLEGFYKDYSDMLLSIEDNIPLADKGTDYGSVGNEALSQGVDGRAYGVELMARSEISGRLSAVGSLTLYRSEYRIDRESGYVPSAWDNKYILSLNTTYNLRRNWSVAAKINAIGGAPYTPYDVERSSYVEAWDTNGRGYLDYTKYNSERLPAYWQCDIRVDKSYYFERWGLSLYLDIQNLFISTFKGADILLSTGEVENPLDSPSEQKYIMKYIANESGTMLPTLGVSIEF